MSGFGETVVSRNAASEREGPGLKSQLLAACAIALLAGLPLDAAVSCDAPLTTDPERIPIKPGHVLELDLPQQSRGLLIEEFGGDLSIRTAPEGEFVPISIRPNRLGIAAVRTTVTTVWVKLDPAHAASVALVRTRCARESDLVFFENLQVHFDQQIDAGAEKAAVVIDQTERELATIDDPHHRAWLLHANANAIMSAGLHEQSVSAFLRARDAWTAIADPARAAVALLAAAEDHSRTGRYDRADELLGQAQTELEAAGIPYYQLRAQAQKCLVLSRRGRVKESVLCETEVAARYAALGEIAAAGASGVSIANQWMKLGDFKLARERLLQVDRHGDALLPVTRAKLHAAFGTYYLQTGELDNAVRELVAASEGMAELGLPADQANIDLKLAGAAQRAGAYDEEIRLLERAQQMLGDTGPQDLKAVIAIRAANAFLAQNDPDSATSHLALAGEICERLNKLDCREQVAHASADALLRKGDLTKAQAILAELPEPLVSGSVVPRRLLLARLELLRNAPAAALQILPDPAPVFSNPDMEVTFALLRSEALVTAGQARKAIDSLQQAIASLSRGANASGVPALRASARHRIVRLQSALFDSFDPTVDATHAVLSWSELRSTIDEHNPLRLLGNKAAAQRLPETLRPALSGAVAQGSSIDQRALFLALASPSEAQVSKSAASDRTTAAGAPPDAGTNTLLVLPLAGNLHFRLLLVGPDSTKQCLSMPRAHFDRLTLEFEAALDGQDVDLAALDREAQRWYDSIRRCDRRSAERWNVVASAGSRTVPWAWIAARAQASGQAEPAVVIQYDTRVHQPAVLRTEGASVLNLDVEGDAALPLALVEANKVASVLATAGVSVRAPAVNNITPDLLFQEMAEAGRWVHIIGHGNSTRYGNLYAGLWLPGPTGASLVTFPEIASTNLNADLVVLSACGDAKQDRVFAGSRLRIAEALLAAGVGQVVASSNAASDSAAAFWTTRFYESLLGTRDPAVAAQAARRALRLSPHFRHPRYWAAIDVFDGGR